MQQVWLPVVAQAGLQAGVVPCLAVSVSCLAGQAGLGHQHRPHQRPARAATAPGALFSVLSCKLSLL
jgi:hypothetical protein